MRWFNARSLIGYTPAEFDASATFDLSMTHPHATTRSFGVNFNIISTPNVEGDSDDEIRITMDDGMAFPEAPIHMGGGVTVTGFKFTESGDGILRTDVWYNPEDGLSFLWLDVYLSIAEQTSVQPLWGAGQLSSFSGFPDTLQTTSNIGTVPLPAGVWLLLTGIGALAAGRRLGRG